MEGLPLLRFSGGPCFLPVRTEREGGMLIRWLKGKNKLKSNKLRGEHKVQTERNPQGVCVLCVCCGQEWTNQSEERDAQIPPAENQGHGEPAPDLDNTISELINLQFKGRF